jgi:carbonic anhydrase
MNKSVYYYSGSETTPPCEEGKLRFVFDHPVYVSES